MNYTLTQHARENLRERSISLAWVDRALTAPEWTETDAVDPHLEHRFAVIPEFGGRVLRVICTDPLKLDTF